MVSHVQILYFKVQFENQAIQNIYRSIDSELVSIIVMVFQ